MLEEDSRLRLSVEGHADEAGEPAENAKLSAQRAQKVRAARGDADEGRARGGGAATARREAVEETVRGGGGDGR
eukprot:2316863-Prymnesium_polylepis.1